MSAGEKEINPLRLHLRPADVTNFSLFLFASLIVELYTISFVALCQCINDPKEHIVLFLVCILKSAHQSGYCILLLSVSLSCFVSTMDFLNCHLPHKPFFTLH